MEVGKFYFLKKEYFSRFSDPYLMQNKDNTGRPFFYSFLDNKTGLYWMIPISSQVDRFRDIYNGKIMNNKKCDTLVFGKFRGNENVFLIQNMCPTTDRYIEEMFVDRKTNKPFSIDIFLKQEIETKAKRVLNLVRNNIKGLVFPDILKIEAELLSKGE